MFDLVNGLPVHPLVVHAVVVLVPLTALIAVLFLVPRFRRSLRWPMVVLALVSLASAALAAETRAGRLARASGEARQGTACSDAEPYAAGPGSSRRR